jgi:hypothetical protein
MSGRGGKSGNYNPRNSQGRGC